MKSVKNLLFVLCFVLSLAVLAQSGDIAIDGVIPDGPAANAGIEAEDRILALNGQKVREFEELEAILNTQKPGDVLRVKLSRGDEILELPVTLGERPDGKASLGVMLRIGAPVPPVADRSIDADERRTVLENIATHLRDGYIYEDKGETLASKLEQAAKSDRFADEGDLRSFVFAVNAYLFEIGNDKHLRIGYQVADQGHGPVGPVIVRKGPGGAADSHDPHGSGDGKRVVRRVGGPGGDDDSYGIREARMLDGNVGYLDLAMFTSSEAAKPHVDEAMLSLKDADALIIDLGRNGGGAPWMVRYLSGFLFDGSQHLTDTWARGMQEPRQRWTLEDQPTKAFNDMPVYILTSGRTFSAAESFTFGLKINDRITIVGERTGGGGHFGDDKSIGSDLRMFLPSGRTYDPETDKGWEAEGIAPDIEVPYSQALERAVEEVKRAG